MNSVDKITAPIDAPTPAPDHPEWCATAEVLRHLGLGHDDTTGEHRGEAAVVSTFDDDTAVGVLPAQMPGEAPRILIEIYRIVNVDPARPLGEMITEASIEIPAADVRDLVRAVSAAQWALTGSPLARPVADDAPGLRVMLGTGG